MYVYSAVDNTGVIEALAGSALYLYGGVSNHGTVEANGGNITISGVDSGGNAIIAGATFEFGAASYANVAFASSSGTLKLDISPSFHGSISGLGVQDAIDLRDINVSNIITKQYLPNFDNSGGVLTVSDGTRTATLDLAGSFSQDGFGYATDNAGGTLITYPGSSSIAIGTWSITPGSQIVNETDGVVTFTVTRSSDASAQTVYISTTQDHGPQNDGDYAGWYNKPVTFAAGDFSESISISVNNGTTPEPDETFGLIVQQSPIDPIDPNLAAATFTIHDDRAAQQSSVLSIVPLDANKNEGNSGSTPFTFTVTRTGDTSEATSVHWSVSAGQDPTAAPSDFTNGPFEFPSGVVTFAPNDPNETKTITVSVHGDTASESGGLAENFVVALSNPSSGATINAQHSSAIGHILNDDPPPSSISFLAELAQASYHLASYERLGYGLNDQEGSAALNSYNDISKTLKLLSPADLAASASVTASDIADIALTSEYALQFPTHGLMNGIYTNGNAAALVGQFGDALYIAFRGTNDNWPDAGLDAVKKGFVDAAVYGNGEIHDQNQSLVNDPNGLFAANAIPAGFLNPYLVDAIQSGAPIGTPDEDSWFAMDQYYSLLTPLLNVVKKYVDDPAQHISHVYVTGHSLGAAMVEKFMSDPALGSDPTAYQKFEAVTFANPGYQAAPNHDTDTRITNIDVSGDLVTQAPVYAAFINKFLPIGGNYQESGDEYTIVNSGGNTHDGDLHDMQLYKDLSDLFSSDYEAQTQAFASNGVVDQIRVYATINYPAANLSDPWSVALPSGPTIDGGTSGTELIRTGELVGGSSIVTTHGANDTVTFGPGGDTFVFTPAGGKDTITNYTPSIDKINVSQLVFNPNPVMSSVHGYNDVAALMQQSGADVVIDFHGGNTLTIENTTTQILAAHQHDFLFI
jgi:Calx-beta domain